MTIFLVLRGKMYHELDGFREEHEAIKAGAGDEILADGWYWVDDENEPDGDGPHATRKDAEEAQNEKAVAMWSDEAWEEVRNLVGKLRETADERHISKVDREAALRSYFSQQMIDLDYF